MGLMGLPLHALDQRGLVSAFREGVRSGGADGP